MIRDEDIFRDGHVPEQLLHRQSEMDILSSAFKPAAAGDRPDDVLLHGPHGVGKSALAQFTFHRLRQQVEADIAHVRCMGLNTAAIVRATLQELGADPALNTPREDLCLQLRERVDVPTVVVLDEGDELPTDALRRLADVDQLAMVPVVHDPDDFLAHISETRITQRLQGQELGLDTYSTAELADILEPRAEKGLATSVSREYLLAIADHAAGVAREGIQTLWAAGTLAGKHSTEVESIPVEDAHERAMRRIRRENLRSLPLHHHICYEIVRVHGPLDGSAFHDRYEDIAEAAYRDHRPQPMTTRRARQKKLEKLATYDLIEQGGRWDDHAVCDRDVRSAVVDLPREADPGSSDA